MNYKALSIAAMLSAWAMPAQAQMVRAQDPSSVVRGMQAGGFTAELGVDNTGDPMISSSVNGTKFKVFFYNCTDHKECATVQFHSGYDLTNPITVERINEWNQTQRFGRAYLDIIPSMGLIGHQWRKHGSCSGLTQRDYLAVTRAAFERVVLPDAVEDADGGRTGPAEIEAALVAANPGLSARGLAVTCDGGRLEEIRICLTPDLNFRDCPEVDRAACRAKTITQPPVR